MNVPSVMEVPMPTQIPMGGMTSPLDDIIGMGETELTETALAGNTAGLQALMDLGYVIPPMGAKLRRGRERPDRCHDGQLCGRFRFQQRWRL